MGEFRMPSLGADMEAGTLVAYRVPVGGSVRRGEIIAEVETEKGVIEVEAFEDGTVERYLVEPGRKVPVGTPLALLGPSPPSPATERVAEAAEAPPAAEARPPAEGGPPATAAEARPSEAQPPRPPTETAYGAASRIPPDGLGPLASPALRRRARELGITLEALAGSGPHGRLTTDDLVRHRRAPERGGGERRGAPPPVTAPGPPLRPRVSPLAQRRASELGVSLEHLSGTGPSGSIVLRDVEATHARAASDGRATPSPAPAPPVPPSAPRPGPAAATPVPSAAPGPGPARARAPTAAERMQHAIAEAMSRSNREIPHYYVSHTIDLGEAVRFVARHNEGAPIDSRIVPGLLFIRAVARAVKTVPGVNGFRREGRTELSASAHVGVAVALRGGGLVAPALFDADDGSLDELMRRFTDLVTRAKRGSLRSSEMTASTITVTSLGERGVEGVLPLIFPPQLAMVGFGAVVERAWALRGEVVVRPVVHATLAADHRVTNGHEGARFLAALADQLQSPEAL